MSLTSFLDIHDVAEGLKPLRPTSPRKIDAALRVQPRTDHYGIVGTAFDYLLRFEIQRRAAHAIVRRWVADHAADHICGTGGYDVVIDAETGCVERSLNDSHPTPATETPNRVHAVVENAKSSVAACLKTRIPKDAQRAELAAHAIRLARLDTFIRAGRLDPQFEHADQEDVEDLLSMLQIAPFDLLLDSNTVLLNPTFGEASRAVGGADADLIAGDLLVDFKVTTTNAIHTTDLDQLLGYYLLARQHRRVDTTFPEIRRVAIYFCRYGYLWALDATAWTSHPEFPVVEEWFFKRAKELFPLVPLPRT